jgi:hypothetical protein
MKTRIGKLGEAERGDLSAADSSALQRYRSGVVNLLDELRSMVDNAPPSVETPRASMLGLLLAIYHLLDIKPGIYTEEDDGPIRSAILALKKALGPLGLGVDYWDKIEEWRRRDLQERSGADADFLVVE